MTVPLIVRRTPSQYTAGEAFLTITARQYVPNVKPLVLYLHGHAAGVGSPPYDPSVQLLPTSGNTIAPCVLPLAENGYPIIAPALGGTNGVNNSGQADLWGNSTVQTLISSAYTWAMANLSPRTTGNGIIVLGASMGAGAGLVWVANNLSKVSQFIGLIPVSDYNSVAALNPTTYSGLTTGAGSLPAAYGLANSTWSDGTYGAYNPARQASALAGKPTLLVCSAADNVIAKSTVLANAVAIGSSARVIDVVYGDHGANLTYPDPATGLSIGQTVVNFALAA